MSHRPFPPGFLWGVASAGHQSEGDNVHSDTWFLGNPVDGLERWGIFRDRGLVRDLKRHLLVC